MALPAQGEKLIDQSAAGANLIPQRKKIGPATRNPIAFMENLLTELQPGQPLDPDKLNIPGENPPDEKKSDSPPAEDGMLAKVHGVAVKTLDAALSRIKPGRGRPRKDGSPKISDTVAEAPHVAPDKTPETVRPMADPKNNSVSIETLDGQIIETVCEVTIFGAADAGKQAIQLYGIKGGLITVDLAPYLDPLKISDKEKDAIVKLIRLFVKKYALTIEYLPEILAGIMVLGIGARFGMTALSVRSLVLEKKSQPPKS